MWIKGRAPCQSKKRKEAVKGGRERDGGTDGKRKKERTEEKGMREREEGKDHTYRSKEGRKEIIVRSEVKREWWMDM